MIKNISTSKGKITIRKATRDDSEALFKLRLEALIAHPEAFAADVKITQARGEQAWEDLIMRDAQDQSGVILISRSGNELIGMTGVGRGHWPKTRHSAIIWGVYVRPDWRGLHIAEAILEECVQWSRDHGIVVLKLGVVTSNTSAIHCYQRVGFTIYGTEPKSSYVDGIYYDEYLMARLIP